MTRIQQRMTQKYNTHGGEYLAGITDDTSSGPEE